MSCRMESEPLPLPDLTWRGYWKRCKNRTWLLFHSRGAGWKFRAVMVNRRLGRIWR